MKECIIILVAIGAVVLLSAVFAALHFYYRRVIEQKDCGIVRQIREQDRLAKELERNRIEKETLERLLQSMLQGISQPSATIDKR
ncbi:MAG: hypothetical protein LBT24_03810 [Tannerella sp.]|jgi:hypothetical protein|nr:hypothetical protein [Tannerella sp.]